MVNIIKTKFISSSRRLLAKILPENIKSIMRPIFLQYDLNPLTIRNKKYYIKIYKIYKKIIIPKTNKPLVSIIIPVYNQWNYTYSCIMAIIKNTSSDISYEIIIGDDNSTDKTNIINKYIKNIIVTKNSGEKGFLNNCNNAAKKAKGKYLVFLNNDTNVQKDWLKWLIKSFEYDTKTGIVGSKLIFPNKTLQEAGGIIWNNASGWNYGRLKNPLLPEFNYVKEVDYISGASICIKKELWNKIGGFDKKFSPAYYEDTDIAFTMRKIGYKVIYQPKSEVIHFEGISNGTNLNSGLKKYQKINLSKFKKKWNKELKNQYKNGTNLFHARDKSSKKKTIVFIDHYVPHYDNDCGSRSTWQYIKAFIKKGWNVKFIGDNYFPHQPYTDLLQQMGVEVLYGSYYKKNIYNWISTNKDFIDLFYIHRPDIAIKYIDYIKSTTKCKIFYQGHDLHYIRELRNYELNKNKSSLKNSNYFKKLELDIIKKSNMSFYFSQKEINILKKLNPSFKIKKIPLYIFDKKCTTNYNPKKRNNIYFIGSFNHKPNIDGLKWFLKNKFPKILKKIPSIKFYIVGKNPPNEITKYKSENIIFTGYISDKELNKLQKKIKLQIVPLRFGAGVKGKIIESMWNGIPVITTPIGSEGINKNYLIIETENLFENAIIKNYNDNKKLLNISKKSQNYIYKNFMNIDINKIFN